MNPADRRRTRLGRAALLLAIGAIAMLALPAAGLGKHGADDVGPDDRGGREDRSRDDSSSRSESVRPDDNGARDDSRFGSRSAGTIQSYDRASGVLVIELGQGGTIAALVDRGTKIRCDFGRHRFRGHSHHRKRSGARASRRGRHGRHRGHDHCRRSDLVAGTTVRKAEIELEDGIAAFDKVHLLPARFAASR